MSTFTLLLLLVSSVMAKVQQKGIERITQEENSEGNRGESKQHLFRSHATSGLPSVTMSMNDLVPLLYALEIGLPFAFAHFNDGEITALHCREGRCTSKKKQPCSVALQIAMRQSLVDRADNFYVGAICPCSFTINQYVQLLQVLNVTYPGIPASQLPNQTPPSASTSSSSSGSKATPTDLSSKQQDQYGTRYNNKRMSGSSGSSGGTITHHHQTTTKKTINNALIKPAPLFLTHGKSDLAAAAAINPTITTSIDTGTSLLNTDRPPSLPSETPPTVSSPTVPSLSNRNLLQAQTALESTLVSINLKNNLGKSSSSKPKLPLKLPKKTTIFDLWKCPQRPPILVYPTPSIQPRLTVGNLFASGNYAYAKKELTRIFNVISRDGAKQSGTTTTAKARERTKKRGIHVVAGLTCNGEHSMYSIYDARRYQYNQSVLPFPIKAYHAVSSRNAFYYNYEEMRTTQFLQHARMQPGDVVLILAGPLGRILASEWCKLAPLTTFLDLGSMWDAELCGKHSPELRDQAEAIEECMYVGDKHGIPPP